MDFMQTVRQRRSVRRFTSQPVPDEALADILDAGRLAPSSGGSNSSYFGVVRDEATKKALAAASGGQDWIATAPVVLALCSRLAPDAAERPADDFFITVNTDRFGADLLEYLNAYQDRRAMRIFSDNAFPIIPGAQISLAVVSHGLASCWIGHLNTARAGEILGLPEDVVCLFLMPIGYPDEIPSEKAVRPVDECVFLDRWSPELG